jgi:hypothetical protein
MGKRMSFSFKDKAWEAGLAKVDRDKVYGYVEEAVATSDGKPCTLAGMLDDGQTLVLPGSTALKTVDGLNREVDKNSIRHVRPDGREAKLVPSSYDAPVQLQEVGLDDIYNLEVSAVYQLDFQDGNGREVAVQALEEVAGLGFVFNFRTDYEGADAVMMAAQGHVFILTGRYVAFSFLSNAPITAMDAPEDESSEDIDFGMM